MTSGDALLSTITPLQAGDCVWDVAVVGAGPAGAMAARATAIAGARTLLIDKATFPRSKVCGSCLNASALDALQKAGLGNLAARLGAVPLDRICLSTSGASAVLRLHDSVAISRRALDAALVCEAIRAGADFLPATAGIATRPAKEARVLVMAHGGERYEIAARVIVCADGLAGRLLDQDPGFTRIRSRSSRIGLGAILECPSPFYESGSIYMAGGRGGYVGMVRLESGELDVAAALDPDFIRAAGSPRAAITRLLAQSSFEPPPGIGQASWHGTPALTSRRERVSGERLLVVGDAAGYVEPFTGQGIAWALSSGIAVAGPALQAVQKWTPQVAETWSRQYVQLIVRRQRSCRMIGRLLRTPWAGRLAVRVLARLPSVVAPLVRSISLPSGDGARMLRSHA